MGLAFGTIGVSGMKPNPDLTQTIVSNFSTTVPTTPDVIEDFEGSSLSEYDFDRGASGASIVSSPTYDGSSALQLTGDAIELISTSGLSTYPAAGDTFSYRVRATTGGDDANFTYGVQDHVNRYFIAMDFEEGDFRFFKFENGSAGSIDGTGSLTYEEDVWYKVTIEWRTDGTHIVQLAHPSDGIIYSLSVSESTWTSGGIGFDAYLSGSQTILFDSVILEPPADEYGVIESFEDGELTDYYFEHGTSGAQIVSSPVSDGAKALELSDTTVQMFSTSGLYGYPAAGTSFSYQVRTSDGNAPTNFAYGVQDEDNYYFVDTDFPDDAFRIFKVVNGSAQSIEGESGLALAVDTWYTVTVDWHEDGTHTARLDHPTSGLVAEISDSDTTWTSGGIGFNAFLSPGETVNYDYVTLTQSTVLGNFETGYDGWTTTGNNSLGQVNYTQQVAPVTLDDTALEVTISSDPEPSIENQQRIQQADLSTYPLLLADVLPASVENSDSAVTFRFRYHHTNPGGIEESPEMTFSQGYGGQLTWDMSGLSAAKLASGERLEIVWYPEEHPPSSSFDYSGVTYIDNVRVTARQDEVSSAQTIQKSIELELTHGPKTEVIVQSETDTVRTGVFKYYDGTEISYRLERFPDGHIEETVDGETVVWEGGSA